MISEYPLGASPHAHRFLQRNRLIAAFSRATIVIEAPIRSGALSTARCALDLGRYVGAVPGPIDSPYSVGCHELIRNGGTLVASANHVRELVQPIGAQVSLPLENPTSTGKSHSDQGDFFSPPASSIGERGQCVLDAVSKRYGQDTASIARESGIDRAAVRAELGKLALQDLVKNKAGLWIKVADAP